MVTTSCDFCNKIIDYKPTKLGEAWQRYGKGLPYKDACAECWGKLEEAFNSWKETTAIRQRNIDAVLKEIKKREKTSTKQRGRG